MHTFSNHEPPVLTAPQQHICLSTVSKILMFPLLARVCMRIHVCMHADYRHEPQALLQHVPCITPELFYHVPSNSLAHLEHVLCCCRNSYVYPCAGCQLEHPGRHGRDGGIAYCVGICELRSVVSSELSGRIRICVVSRSDRAAGYGQVTID